MRNLVATAADGNLLPEPLTCQRPCVYWFNDGIRTSRNFGTVDSITYYINFALICIFKSSISWLHYKEVKKCNINMMDLYF
jgi:hypothetical protein